MVFPEPVNPRATKVHQRSQQYRANPQLEGVQLPGMERLQNRVQKVKIIRYASLYFITIVDKDDNELLALETIHYFVEILDKYFNNVCELDLIFNFHKVWILGIFLYEGWVGVGLV